MPRGQRDSEPHAGRVQGLPGQPRPGPHRDQDPQASPVLHRVGLGPLNVPEFHSFSAQQGRPTVQCLGAKRETLTDTIRKGQGWCKACRSQGGTEGTRLVSRGPAGKGDDREGEGRVTRSIRREAVGG